MIDYENEFKKYINSVMKQRKIDDISDIEDEIDTLYDKWLKEPNESFSNKTPYEYFDDISDPIKLIDVLGKYIYNDVQVPGPLLTTIGKYTDSIYPLFVVSIKNYHIDDKSMSKFIMYCIEMISEMDKQHPLDEYIRIIKSSTVSMDVIEAMVEVLRFEIDNDGLMADIKKAYLETEHEFAKDCFLDLMCEVKEDKDVYEYVLDCFLNDISKSWLYAHMLAKIGNSECEEYLIERLKSEELDYYNYSQVKEALEELGGVLEIERSFFGDEDYEIMSEMPKVKDDGEYRSMIIKNDDGE